LWCTVQLGLGRLILEVSRPPTIRYAQTQARARTQTHTHTHTHPVGLLRTSDQLVAEATTYTTHNNGNRNHNPTNRADADLHLRPHDYRDRSCT
jgi:hypothetical protein